MATIKYKWTLTPMIDTVKYLQFGTNTIEADLDVDELITNRSYEGEVEDVTVGEKLYIRLEVGGASGSWELDIKVVIDGKEYPLKTTPKRGSTTHKTWKRLVYPYSIKY